MALQASGQISLSDVNDELSLSSTAQIALNDAAVRGLIGKGSGAQFGLAELYGASSVVGWAYFIVQPQNSFTSARPQISGIAISSNNEYFLTVSGQHKTNRASSVSANQQMELLELNSDGVEQNHKGFSLAHIGSEANGHKFYVESNTNQYRNANKIFLRGTTDIYFMCYRETYTIFNQANYSTFGAAIPSISKYNQSNLDAEDKRWTHNHFQGRPTNGFGTIQSNVVGQSGYQYDPKNAGIFIDKNNKLVYYATYPGGVTSGDLKFYYARYPVDSAYDTAPEFMAYYRIHPKPSGWSPYSGSDIKMYAKSTTVYTHFFANQPSSHTYALYDTAANLTQSNGSSAYTTYNSNQNTSNKHIHKLNVYAHVEFCCPDKNNYPAVFGKGGAKSQNGTIGDNAIWCQKHTSSNTKSSVRFSFTGDNFTSASNNYGNMQAAVFDSSDNCYMAGVSAITRDLSSNSQFARRGPNSYNRTRITWIAKFNSSGVYQNHLYLDISAYRDYIIANGVGSGFAAQFGATAHDAYVQIADMAIDTEGNLVITGTTMYDGGVGGNTVYYGHMSAFVMKLPADLNVSAGHVKVQSSINSATRDVGVYVGKFEGDGQSSGSQFYWANQSTGNIFQNDASTTTSFTLYSAKAGSRSHYANGGSSYATSTMPAFPQQGWGLYGGVGAGRSQSDGNGNFLPHTPPSEVSGAGKVEF